MNTSLQHDDGSPVVDEALTGHRIFELVSIAACLALMGWIGSQVVAGMIARSDVMVVVAEVATSTLAGYLAADFVSGLVHWMADRFGTEDTPILGKTFIHPFRLHHTDPLEMTLHDFVDINGHNGLVLLLFLVPVALLMPARLVVGWMWVTNFSLMFAVAIFLTNQFHKWSHMTQRPAPVRWLQRYRLILAPAVHDLHHTSPFDSDYCITCGWLNPLLNRLDFFARCEAVLTGRRLSDGAEVEPPVYGNDPDLRPGT